MTSNKPEIEKSIDRLNQLVPHAPEEPISQVEVDGFPGIEYIIPPDVHDEDRATVILKNGAKWEFSRVQGGYRLTSVFPNGSEHESVIDRTVEDPMSEIRTIFRKLKTHGIPWLQAEFPGFWAVL